MPIEISMKEAADALGLSMLEFGARLEQGDISYQKKDGGIYFTEDELDRARRGLGLSASDDYARPTLNIGVADNPEGGGPTEGEFFDDETKQLVKDFLKQKTLSSDKKRIILDKLRRVIEQETQVCQTPDTVTDTLVDLQDKLCAIIDKYSGSGKQIIEGTIADAFDDVCGWHSLMEVIDGQPFPAWHQYIRAKRALGMGRVLFADWTGAGKTAAAILTEMLLAEEKQRPIKTLVTAPKSAVQSAWAPGKINSYYRVLNKRERDIVHVLKPSDLSKITDYSEIVVINDDKFSLTKKPQDNPYFQHLIRYSFDLIIADEIHREKNHRSNRGRAVRELVNTINHGCNLVLLTATPIKNEPNDLGMLLHLLDPGLFPKPHLYDYEKDYRATREVLDRYMFRLTRTELAQIFPLPELEKGTVRIPLDNDLVDKYVSFWSGDVRMSPIKLSWTLRRLLAEQKIRELERGDLIDGILDGEEQEGRGGQVAIYSELKEGVIDRLENMLAERYSSEGIVRMDGDKGVFIKDGKKQYSTDREWLSQRFRDGDARIVLFTSVMGEGVELNTNPDTNRRPITLIKIEPSINYGSAVQVTGRFDRIGQKEKVTALDMVVESPELKQLMLDSIEFIEERYDIFVPRKFKGRTMDQDMSLIGKVRMDGAAAILDGRRLSEVQQLIAKGDDKALEWCIYFNLLSLLPTESPHQTATRIAAGWNGIGVDGIKGLQEKEIWKVFVDLYNRNWNYSASAHTARLINKVVAGLEEKLGRMERILDAGCGAAYMSRAFGREMTCIDLSQEMLELGRAECEKLGLSNNYIQGRMQETGLAGKELDLVVSSYVMHYQSQKNGSRELEDALLEFNRILKKDGHLIMTLPRNLDDAGFEAFNNALSAYGFELCGDLSGFYKVSRCKEVSSGNSYEKKPNQARFKGVYMTVVRKKEDVTGYQDVDPNEFALYRRRERAFIGGREKKKVKKAPPLPKKEICTDFAREGIGVDALVEDYISRMGPPEPSPVAADVIADAYVNKNMEGCEDAA